METGEKWEIKNLCVTYEQKEFTPKSTCWNKCKENIS